MAVAEMSNTNIKSEYRKIDISSLKTNEEVDFLVPRMNEQEWKDFFKSVERDGIRQPIDINKDMTIIDGRHRVDAAKLLGYTEIEARVHDLDITELFKFVRDTAIERRHLTKEQRLHIVLSTTELIEELEYEANERKLKNLKQNTPKGSVEPIDKKPEPKKDTRTNSKLGELAGVSKSTVVRAKKIKKENPDGYDKVINGESTFAKEYDALPSVINKTNPAPRFGNAGESNEGEKKAVGRPKKYGSVDLRMKINDEAMSLEEIKLQLPETAAINILDYAGHINDLIDEVGDVESIERVLSTLDYKQIIKLQDNIKKIITIGGYK